MERTKFAVVVSLIFVPILVAGAALHTWAQDNKAPYPSLAPLDQYLIDRDAEIAMARSAAPESISRDARILVLGRHGYETAVEGRNGFVCIVDRAWTSDFDDPAFMNPTVREPICFNAAAARSRLLLTFKQTAWALAGQTRTQMFDSIKAAYDKKALPVPEPGAMSYMMSSQTYFGPINGKGGPHLMFYFPKNRRYGLGRRSAWLSRDRPSRLAGADHHVRHPAVEIFGRDGCTHGYALTFDAHRPVE